MKSFKRNVVVTAVLLFVCAAVFLNWRFNQREADLADVDASYQEAEDAGLYYSENAAPTGTEGEDATAVSEYFSQARLTRQQARDAAIETLKLVGETEGASQETVASATENGAKIAAWTVAEAELENQIIAKGYTDCVVTMADEGVTVTVAVGEDGLSSAGAAQITEIVCAGTDYSAADLKIIEIK